MDGLGNFYKLQQLAYLGYLMNGDAFAALPMCEQVGQPYGLRVRVMEADRICSPDGYDRLAPCTVRGYEVHNIVQGVETNAEGRVVAYWVCNRHPLSDTSMLGSGLEWTRVEARGELTGRRNIVHVITRERAGQLAACLFWHRCWKHSSSWDGTRRRRSTRRSFPPCSRCSCSRHGDG